MGELKVNAPQLFKPSKGSGSGGGDGKGGGSAIKFKEALKGPQEKADFIGQHGMDKYLELPYRKKETG